MLTAFGESSRKDKPTKQRGPADESKMFFSQ